MKKTLEKAAKFGRFGDDRLLHVSQEELDGLGSLLPGGKLPTNPDTGLPEAFFFLPLLAGLASAAAPAAAATGAALAGTAAAAAPAALAAAAPLAAGTAAAGAGAAGAAGAGLGALGAAAAPTAATAAMPALAGASTALAPTAMGAGAAGLPSVLAGTPMAGTAAAAPLAAKTAAAPIAAAAKGAGALGSSVIPGAGTAATLADAAGAAGVGGMAPAASSGGGGLASLFGGLDTGKLLQYGALGAMMLPRGGGGGGGDDKDSKKNVNAKQYDSGDVAEAPDEGAQGGTSREFNYFPHARYYADGGLASLSADKMSSGGPDDNELIDATVAALQGQIPNGEAIIQQFISTFGPDALKDLMSQVQGKQAQSDGMSDSVPAQISGGLGSIAPAQLSEGEYVVPADVVSHIGNGSTEAGARQLKGMEERVRGARGAQAPTAINPQAALPA